MYCGMKEICQKIFQGSQPKDLKGGTQVVGLYGMGGHGKTTACKILCKELSTYYNDKVCHVELGSRSEEELLQKALKLLSNLDVDKFDDSKVKMDQVTIL
jgi:signal recognition particle GTPase